MVSNLAQLHIIDPRIRSELELVGGLDLFQRLVDLFFTDSEQLLRTIDTARASGDSSSVAKAAHRLKGGAAAVGAQRVAALASHLENAAKDVRGGQLDTTRASLDAEMSVLRGAIAG